MQSAAGKKLEIRNGLSPGDQGFTNQRSWVLWRLTYSTWVSIVLHVKSANSSVYKECLKL